MKHCITFRYYFSYFASFLPYLISQYCLGSGLNKPTAAAAAVVVLTREEMHFLHQLLCL